MKRNIIAVLTLLLIIFSCSDKVPSTEHIDVDISIKRFDQSLFSLPVNDIAEGVKKLKQEYPRMFPLFNYKIIEIGGVNPAVYNELITRFITDYYIYQTYTKTQNLFNDISWLENELQNSFKYYKYYFPNKNIPEIFTFVGEFNQSIVVADSLIGIGLDKYLGPNEEFYTKLSPPFPNYQLYWMEKDRITADVMYGWISTEFAYNDSIDNLVSHIIHQGKVMYLMDKVMPYAHDTLKFGFTPLQLSFCQNNEKQMWTHLVEKKLLFVNDPFIIRQFIERAPFTKEFSSESPSQAAIWIGREIVKSYMRKNKEISVIELMNNTNYLEILNKSGYNP